MKNIRHLLSVVAVAAGIGIAGAAAVEGATLTGGTRATFRDRFGVEDDSARIRVRRDEVLVTGPSPLCPAQSRLRLGSNRQRNDLVVLPCQNWVATGSGYRYRDPFGSAGGVRAITYQPRRGQLSVSIRGGGYAAVTSPVQYVDFLFEVDATSHCARFNRVLPSSTSSVVLKGPTVACGVCGNGTLDLGETCDDRNAQNGDGCDANCTTTGCGNGIRTAGEQCDDGNLLNGDGCRVDCTVEGCGDGVLDAGEACDDGANEAGDCCSPTCQLDGAGTACTPDDNACSSDVCDGAGTCTHPPSAAGTPCDDDGNVCTDDLCDGSGSCAAIPNTAPCSDGSFCTTGDVCAAGECVGSPRLPWINELDYDGGTAGATPDQDEFIEIAAPSGTDLSGYRVLSVEGNPLPPCGTGLPGVLAGEANLSAVLPPGSVVGDPEDTGIGFLVVCFQNTSANQAACDVVLPALDPVDNLRDGDLLNLSATTCPDGVLLLDPSGGFVDAVSYEGVVPGTGTYGPAFRVTPYNLGRDLGGKPGVSFEKRTSTFTRAVSGTEWRLSGGCTTAAEDDAACLPDSHTAGQSNPEQGFQCAEQECGNGLVEGSEDCDEGAANSDAPDATCRTDCSAQRCGDAIVDPGFGEQCEVDADCAAGAFCSGCGCFVSFDLTVVPGPSQAMPVDDGESTWLRITPLFGTENGTNGQFNPGPLDLARLDPPRPDGTADLLLRGTAILGANDPLGGKLCFKIEQDPQAVGEIDCDGGSNYDVLLTGDSNGTGANGSPALTIGAGATDSGSGAGVIRVLFSAARSDDGDANCNSIAYAPAVRTALTTATARAEIRNTRQGGDTVVTLSGERFDCTNWTSDSGASIAAPNLSYDFVLPLGLGTQDVAQVLRLNDD